MLTDIAENAELFHTLDGTAFVDLVIDGHRETWPIRSTRFRTWFRHRYYKTAGSPPSAGAIGSALDLLEARAQFDAPRQDIYVRTAEHEGCIYLDLADELWRAVKTPRIAGKLFLPPGCRHAAAPSAGKGRIDRGTFVISQSLRPMISFS